jgi:hypothetical protein
MSSAVDDSLVGLEPEVDAFIRELLERAAAIRLPELFREKPGDAIYWVGDRHGVSTVALRTTSLTHEQLVAIMTFRLAQYLMAHQLDPRLIYAERLAHEPLTNVSPGDVHVIAGSASDGEILSYVTLEFIPESERGKIMGDDDRRLFPVESVFGAGIFNRLTVVPDLPVDRVCELGRFMKNHGRTAFDDVATRGTVELVLCLAASLHNALRQYVDVGIGDFEEGVAKKSIDFFHVPLVVLHGVVPYVPERSFGFFNYQHRTRYPFAMLFSDIPPERMHAIEAALQRPGKAALVELLELKKIRTPKRSSLAHDGLPPLVDAPVPQEGLPMAVRRQLLDIGDWLRTTTLFKDLSVPEAAVLATCLERWSYEPGTRVIRQGDAGNDIFVIEEGTVEVKLTTPDGRYVKVRELGPRDYFGEIALLVGGERTADVIATSALTLLRLTQDGYARYLANLVEVERDLTKTALARTQDTLRAHKPTE